LRLVARKMMGVFIDVNTGLAYTLQPGDFTYDFTTSTLVVNPDHKTCPSQCPDPSPLLDLEMEIDGETIASRTLTYQKLRFIVSDHR
jgi:hypothetical protein